MTTAARILIHFFEGLKKSDLKSLFSSSDVTALAKLTLNLIVGSIKSYPAVTLLRASAEIIAKLENEFIIEWTKADNIPIVFAAVNALNDLVVSLRNGLQLDRMELSGYLQITSA